MCGISAWVDVRSQSSQRDTANLPETLDRSLDLLAHRGPDSRGQWISHDARIALGHVRLAINDLSDDGAQPFHDPDDTVHAVVNGELYDHESIRRDLTAKTRYRFKGHSDCEIVIALYQYYGLSFLDHLRGEFALCLYDARSKLFIAARDRYGIKPLFYTTVGGRLLFAAEAKAFLPLGWAPEWDVQSIMELGWGHDDRTLFRGVSKIRPGHYLCVNASGDIRTMPYWDIDYPDKSVVDPRSESEMVEAVRHQLVEAVRVRLRADVPVGVYLSGGIDSSVIAGILTHLVREQDVQLGNDKELDRVNAFTIAFDHDSGFDESSIAARTADLLQIKLHKKHMTEAALADRFADATYHCEHHYPDLNFVGKFALSEEPREHGTKVVLTGEGADELFAGYPAFLPDFLREPDAAYPHSHLPEAERQQLLEEHERASREYYTSVGADATAYADPPAERALAGLAIPHAMAAFRPRVFATWAREAFPHASPIATMAAAHNGVARSRIAHSWHPLNGALYLWARGNLANQFLTCLGDRSEMAHSIEARVPFLDHVLAATVNALPPSTKVRWDPIRRTLIQKHILREAARPFVSDEIYHRVKHPYTAPATWPPGGPLHQLLRELLTRESIAALGFVEWDSVADVVERAFERADAAAMRTAFVVAQWVVLSRRLGVKTAGPGAG